MDDSDDISIATIPSFNLDGLNSLAATVFRLMERLRSQEKEIIRLKNALETSRKLQQKPRLYPPLSDPYFGDENDGC